MWLRELALATRAVVVCRIVPGGTKGAARVAEVRDSLRTEPKVEVVVGILDRLGDVAARKGASARSNITEASSDCPVSGATVDGLTKIVA